MTSAGVAVYYGRMKVAMGMQPREFAFGVPTQPWNQNHE